MIKARDSTRREKTLWEVIVETYKDFAGNTSIHGLKYTVRDDISKLEKLFWVIVVLTGLYGAAHMTVLFWQRYTSNPTRTSIKTDFAPPSDLPFPAITICTINRIMYSEVKSFKEKLEFDPVYDEIILRALTQLLAYTSPEAAPYNQTELDILQTVLEKNEILDPTQVMRRLRHNCNELILKCRWMLEDVACDSIIRESLTPEGFCCSFNFISAHDEIRYTTYSGIENGLVLLLRPRKEMRQFSTLFSSGVKIIIHYPEDYPDDSAITKVLSGGTISFVHLMGTRMECSKEVQLLSIEQRKCVYSYETSLKYFSTYADTNCGVEMLVNHLHKKCGCIPYFYPFSGEFKTCNASSIQCLDFATKSYVVEEFSYCMPQCEDIFYNARLTSTKIDARKGLGTSSFMSSIEDELNEDTILVYINFGFETQTILLRDTVTTSTYLISSFGGVYSLFLGCSLITVVEILYYCLLRFVLNLKLFRQIGDGDQMYYNKNKKVQKRKSFKRKNLGEFGQSNLPKINRLDRHHFSVLHVNNNEFIQ